MLFSFIATLYGGSIEFSTADSATKKHGVIIDCGKAESGDATLPL